MIKRAAKRTLISARYWLSRERCAFPFEEAEKRLNTFHPMPESSALTHNTLDDALYDLMIIVPAYNASEWIGECILSILNQQTKYTFLLKIIDDGSTDGTGEMVDGFSEDPRVEVIHQENRGYSGARNRGLEHISGRYIMFVDADDKLLPGAISALLDKAVADGADIVEGNGFRFDEHGRIGTVKTPGSRGLTGVPWMKVYRSELFEKIHFPNGYLYEDKIIGSLILQIAERQETVPNEVYAYRIHAGSITQRHDDNPQRVDSYWMMWLMQREQEKLGIPANYGNYVRTARQIVMTYRRTELLPEEIKQAIFVGSKRFLDTYYAEYLETDDRCKPLVKAIENGQYGKYKVFCENYMI